MSSEQIKDTKMTVSQFIAKIAEEVGQGREFCPFLGAGISHPSGIMMGRGFTSYLAYTFCRCVLSKEDQAEFGLPQNNGQRDLSSEGWPAFPKPEQLAKVRAMILERFKPLRKTSGLGKVEQNYGLLSRPLVPECLTESQDDQVKEWIREDDRVILPYWRNHYGNEVKRALTEERFCPNRAHPSEREILDYGISCLADWRATLNFLARLKVDRGADGQVTLALSKKPELRLVDSFSTHLGLGKKPNLNHMMVVHLSRMLRMQVLFTTNFDTLLEDAFVSARQPLQVIPVSLKGDLPDPASVWARRTLLKLHGTLHETRADWSLDETPSRRDVGAFIEYLRARDAGLEVGGVSRHRRSSRHLLVLGFAGMDVRVIDYLRAALVWYPDLHIFWVANSDRTKPDELREKLGLEESKDRLLFTVTAHTDLLLYELYQRLGKYLPPSGFSYQFSLNVPAWVEKSEKGNYTRLLHDALELREPGMILGLKAGTGAEIDEARVLRFDSGVSASENIGRLYAHAVGRRKNCMWLELEDFKSAAAVGTVILHNIAYRLGLFNREHVDLTLACEELEHGRLAGLRGHLRYLTDRYLDTSASEWMVFVYGRCAPGSCAGWVEPEGTEWSEAEWKRLLRLLEAFSSIGYRIVLMPQTGNRRTYLEAQDRILREVMPDSKPPNLVTRPPLEKWEASIGQTLQPKTTGIETLAKVLEWLCNGWKPQSDWGGASGGCEAEVKDRLQKALRGLREAPNEGKIHFLYALTQFRQSRHPASLISEGVFSCSHRFNREGIDNDSYRFEWTRRWTDELVRAKVFFHKDGGYLWMYGDIRQHLRFILENWQVGRPLYSQLTRRAKTHYWIAEWYFFAFLSSGHPDPLIESIHHRMQSVFHLPTETKRKVRESDGEEIAYRLELLHGSLCKLSKTLFVARHRIASWSQLLRANGAFDADEIRAQLGNPTADGSTFDTWLHERVGGDASLNAAIGIRAVCREVVGQVAFLQSTVANVGDNLSDWHPPIPQGEDDWHLSTQEMPSPDPVKETLVEGNRQYIEKIYKEKFGLRVDDPNYAPVYAIDAETETDKRHVKAARESIVECLRHKPRRLIALAHAMRSHAYFIYKHANLKMRSMRLAEEPQDGELVKNPTLVADEMHNRILYQRCTVYCRLALEVLTHLPVAFVYDENALRYELHILYGVALANLDRFQEAQRRLTEADYLTHVMEAEIIAEKRGILHLRRAEVDLLQARYYRRVSRRENWNYSRDELLGLGTDDKVDNHIDFSKDRLAALRIAKINDAVTELDAAEAGLAGRSRSTLWWHKLCVLRLLCIAMEDPKKECGTTCRQPVAALELMRDWFEQGLFLTTRDAYRRMQIYDAYRQALRRHFSTKAWRELGRISPDKIVGAIRDEVKREIGPYLCRLRDGLDAKLAGESNEEVLLDVIQAMLGDGNRKAFGMRRTLNGEPACAEYAKTLAAKIAGDFQNKR